MLLKKTQFNVIVDGTFAYHDALKNIERSLDRNRLVEIYYLYQEPQIAWEITKKREALEHRNVPRDAFISSFVRAREHVELAKRTFSDRIKLNLIIRNARDKNAEKIILDIDQIDQFLDIRYTVDTLGQLIL